ncbi:MAG TPA: universal stress protein [Gaiellaceae bacterium]
MSVATANALGIFDRIVCGLDDSPEALEAARQAARLRSSGGLLRLAAVADVGVAVHAGFAMSHVLEELDASAREALHRAIDTVHPDSTHLLAGDPVSTLLDEVARTGATLVAVGPHGHSRALGMLLGGVSTALLHEAPCSVLLARSGRYGPFPSSIIAGVDGSEQSLAAWDVARSVAERFDAELVTVAARGGKGVDADRVQELDPDAVLDPRKPVEALVDLSAEADLLVVGSRGLHGPAALGSVSERVAHRAPSSVLVVRQPPVHDS